MYNDSMELIIDVNTHNSTITSESLKGLKGKVI